MLLPTLFNMRTMLPRRAGVATASAATTVKMPAGLVVNTPLVESMPLSELVGTRVLLKMDALQPSGSFKDRGMAYMCSTLQARGATSLISSSGGNAGHAVATVGRQLGMAVRVIVPTTTKPLMVEKIKAQGAEVQVHGANWNEADALARELVEAAPEAEYIPPYENPLLWTGHSSLIDEVAAAGERPGAVVASVGGGGLFCGLVEGLQRHGWDDVAVLTAETEGAACFARAVEAGESVRLGGIESVATSLGALEASPTALRLAAEHPTEARTVTDAEAVDACAKFLDVHRIMVEPACGASLALAFSERHRAALARFDSVVVVVCGGSGGNWEIMEGWRDLL